MKRSLCWLLLLGLLGCTSGGNSSDITRLNIEAKLPSGETRCSLAATQGPTDGDPLLEELSGEGDEITAQEVVAAAKKQLDLEEGGYLHCAVNPGGQEPYTLRIRLGEDSWEPVWVGIEK